MTVNDLLFKDFRPKSTLKAKRTDINKAKFPVIDMHNHLTPVFSMGVNLDPAELVKLMDDIGILAMANLNGGWGNPLHDNIKRFDQAYPGRFLTFCNIDFSLLVDIPAFNTHVKKTIKEGAKLGMRAIKIFKEVGLRYMDREGKIVLPDDDRLRIIWETAAEVNLPVLYHIADPEAFFQPLDANNERIEQLLENPRWSFCGPEFPLREKLFECQQKMLEQNPDTRYILPHIASNPEDLGYVSYLLDTYKNFVVDTSARIGDLGRQPYAARKFLIKYADRILYGLDSTPTPEAYTTSFRFFETDDEYFSDRGETSKVLRRWMIYGVFLPDDVLQKIYHDNTIKVLGKLY